MLHFEIDDRFSYDKDNHCFVVESSMLYLPARDWNSLRTYPSEDEILLTNPKTDNSKIFRFTHADKSPENEVGGWNYQSKDNIGLLIIND
jgi:hypothetical protein